MLARVCQQPPQGAGRLRHSQPNHLCLLLLPLHCVARLHVFVVGAFGHVLHMVPLLYVKLGKHSYVSLYVIAEDVMRALACCRLGCAVGSVDGGTDV